MAYPARVVEFARIGGELIATNAAARYGPAVADSKRPLEPGFIPVKSKPRLTIISYYPYADTLDRIVVGDAEDHFLDWGRNRDLKSYQLAYEDWLNILPDWPFYKRWLAYVVDEVGLQTSDLAWIPLSKLPGTLESPPTDEMIRVDRGLLRRQLELLRPDVVLIQSKEVFENAGGLIQEFQRNSVVQKLFQRKSARTSAETPTIIKALKRYLALPQTS